MAQEASGLETFTKSFRSKSDGKVEIAIFPSYVQLHVLQEKSAKAFRVGAQDLASAEKGAHTGLVSARQIKESGIELCLIGHSECRARGDQESSLLEKLKRAQEESLGVCYCVGESLEERDQGKLEVRLATQMANLKDFKPLCVAYEPVWAIGTGRVASTEQIADVMKYLKGLRPDLDFLYGGSVSPENAQEILEISGVSGLLIGGASLKPESLEKIVEAARLVAGQRGE